MLVPYFPNPVKTSKFLREPILFSLLLQKDNVKSWLPQKSTEDTNLRSLFIPRYQTLKQAARKLAKSTLLDL